MYLYGAKVSQDYIVTNKKNLPFRYPCSNHYPCKRKPVEETIYTKEKEMSYDEYERRLILENID